MFLLVKEVMTPHVVSIAPEESAALAARLLARHGLGALPVCSAEGILRGMVTDRDIVLRCVAPEADPKSVPVKEIMSRRLAAVAPGDDVRQAARLMARRRSVGCRWWRTEKSWAWCPWVTWPSADGMRWRSHGR